MQQTSPGLMSYIFGTIFGKHDTLNSISNNKPYVPALIAFILSIAASFLLLIFSAYLQFQSFIGKDLTELGITEELAAYLPTTFSVFLDSQIIIILIFIGAAVLIWLLFLLFSFVFGKLLRGQGKFIDIFLFHLFLAGLIPLFLFFVSLFFVGSIVAVMSAFVFLFILTILCLRAEYKGIKTLQYVTGGAAMLALLLSILMIFLIGGIVYSVVS